MFCYKRSCCFQRSQVVEEIDCSTDRHYLAVEDEAEGIRRRIVVVLVDDVRRRVTDGRELVRQDRLVQLEGAFESQLSDLDL